MATVIKQVNSLPKGLSLSIEQDSIDIIKTIWPFYQHFDELEENQIIESWKKILLNLKANLRKTPKKLHLGFHFYASDNFLRQMANLIINELKDIKNLEFNYFTVSQLINISHSLTNLTHLKIHNFRCKINDKTFQKLGSTISRYLNDLELLDLVFIDWDIKLKNQSLETLAANVCRDLKRLKYLALTFERPYKSINDWEKVRNCIYTSRKSLPPESLEAFLTIRCGPKEKDGLVFDMTQSPKECTLKFTNSKTMNNQEIIAFSSHLSSYFANLKHLKLNCSQLSAYDLGILQNHICSMANLNHLYLSFRGSKDIADENVSGLFLNISNSLTQLNSLYLTFRSCIKIEGKCLKLVGKKLRNEFMSLSKLVLDFSSCIWITEEEIVPLLVSISERESKLEDSVLCFNGCYRVPSEAKADLKDMAALIEGLDITLFQERADWE